LLFVAQVGYVAGVQPAADRPWVPVPRLVSDVPALQVFDKARGELIARIELPENATGALMTYIAGGKQYLVVPLGGGNIRRAGSTEPAVTDSLGAAAMAPVWWPLGWPTAIVRATVAPSGRW